MSDAQNIIIEPKPEINVHQIIENNYIVSVDSSLYTPIYMLYDRAQVIEIRQNYLYKF